MKLGVLGAGKIVQELMQVYDRKHASRGGFRNRIFLISKEG